MTEAETPDDDSPEVEVYEPYPIGLSDGDCLLFDPVEFAERFDAMAVISKDGCLFVLQRETLEWKKVEPHKAASPRALKTVQ